MIVIKTSSDNKQILEKIALKLLNQKVAGCVNLFPACISYFVWDNKINKSKENLLFIKTIRTISVISHFIVTLPVVLLAIFII